MRKVKAHTTPEAVLAGAACKLVLLEHRAPPNVVAARLSAILAVTRMAQWIAHVGSARQRLDIDSTWIPGTGV